MHQSFVSTAPPPTGMGGDDGFLLSRALWGKADDNYPALCPTLHNRKSQQGKCPQCYTPTLPMALRGQSKNNCPAPYPGYPTAIPVGGGRGYK